MADLSRAPQGVSWGRTSDGLFTLVISVTAPTADGGAIEVPCSRFVLTKEEEVSLKASLSGLAVVTGSSITDGGA